MSRSDVSSTKTKVKLTMFIYLKKKDFFLVFRRSLKQRVNEIAYFIPFMYNFF